MQTLTEMEYIHPVFLHIFKYELGIYARYHTNMVQLIKYRRSNRIQNIYSNTESYANTYANTYAYGLNYANEHIRIWVYVNEHMQIWNRIRK